MIFFVQKLPPQEESGVPNMKQAYLFLWNYQRTFKVILHFKECNIITENNDQG